MDDRSGSFSISLSLYLSISISLYQACERTSVGDACWSLSFARFGVEGYPPTACKCAPDSCECQE